MQEVQMLQTLDHPNILRVYETFEDKKRYFIVTELCTGGELFDEISNRVFSEIEASSCIQQVLTAINYCHEKNIMHRDLKPESLLLDSHKDNIIKLIDFGMAQTKQNNKKQNDDVNRSRHDDEDGVKLGNAYYIAPEMLQNQVTPKSDIWSIGVILFVLLTGVPPFNGDDDKEIIDKVKTGKYNT